MTLAVRKAVNSLPLELRQIVLMKEFEELTFREISDALDLPLSTVKSRLYTALKQLHMKLHLFDSEVVEDRYQDDETKISTCERGDELISFALW